MYIGPMMKKISEMIERDANEQIKQYRLTLTQSKIVLYLLEHDDLMCTQKELEDWLEVSHPTTVNIVRSMEQKGFIETHLSSSDKRMKMVHLIWGNEAIYQELISNADGLEKKLIRGFSDSELKVFEDFMNRVYKNACDG